MAVTTAGRDNPFRKRWLSNDLPKFNIQDPTPRNIQFNIYLRGALFVAGYHNKANTDRARLTYKQKNFKLNGRLEQILTPEQQQALEAHKAEKSG